MIDDPKFQALKSLLLSLQKVAVAFSGGLDSTFLLTVAAETMGDHIIAFTMNTPYIPDWEVREATNICRHLHIKHVVFDSGIPDTILNNPDDRCYLCKINIFGRFVEEAEKLGNYVVADGTNLDDLYDLRPGIKALKELNIVSPLKICNYTKEDIRKQARMLGIRNWNKPAYACLLTRLPHNIQINKQVLIRIEQAELFLHKLGYKESRVRIHDTGARIEINQEYISQFLSNEKRQQIIEKFHRLGFTFISLDLEGYRMGSMNIKMHKDES